MKEWVIVMSGYKYIKMVENFKASEALKEKTKKSILQTNNRTFKIIKYSTGFASVVVALFVIFNMLKIQNSVTSFVDAIGKESLTHNSNEPNGNTVVETQDQDPETESETTQSGATDLNSIKTQPIELSANNNGNDESQSYWSSYNHSFARGDNGYYYLDINNAYESSFIMFFDETTQTSKKVCNKPSCSHNDSTCDAFLSSYQSSSIWLYKGYLYLIKYTYTSTILERVNIDGTNRVDIATIGPDFESPAKYNLVFTGNDVYVYNISGIIEKNNNMNQLQKNLNNISGYSKNKVEFINNSYLVKISLDGKMNEKIYIPDGLKKIESVKCFGGKIFFVVADMQTYLDTRLQGYLGLYCYDPQTNGISKILDKPISDYTFDTVNGFLYYIVYGDGTYKMKLTSNEAIKISDLSEDNEISYDGTYLYVYIRSTQNTDLQGKLFVLNTEGLIMNEFQPGTYNNVYFGDDKYLFIKSYNISQSTFNDKLGFIKKSEITSTSTFSLIE